MTAPSPTPRPPVCQCGHAASIHGTERGCEGVLTGFDLPNFTGIEDCNCTRRPDEVISPCPDCGGSGYYWTLAGPDDAVKEPCDVCGLWMRGKAVETDAF